MTQVPVTHEKPVFYHARDYIQVGMHAFMGAGLLLTVARFASRPILIIGAGIAGLISATIGFTGLSGMIEKSVNEGGDVTDKFGFTNLMTSLSQKVGLKKKSLSMKQIYRNA